MMSTSSIWNKDDFKLGVNMSKNLSFGIYETSGSRFYGKKSRNLVSKSTKYILSSSFA
jgi:hypothetical protein